MRSKLTEAQKEFLKGRLIAMTLEKAGDKENNDICRDAKESIIWRNFSMDFVVGSQVYDAFSDEELIDIIRRIALILNHSPARKESFLAGERLCQEKI